MASERGPWSMLARPRVAAGLLLLALAAVAVAVLLQGHVRGITVFATESWPVPRENMALESGKGWVADVHPRWWSGDHAPSPARLFEDGKEIGPGNASNTMIQKRGGGRYRVGRGRLYFSTPDGSDPRSNGRSYVLTGPSRVITAVRYLANAAAVGLVLLALLALRRAHGTALAARLQRVLPVDGARRWFGAGGGVGPWRVCLLVGAVALVVRIVAVVLVFADPTAVSGCLVVGVPYSDAQGWDSLGESVMRGDGLAGGWSARRPFMALAIGALYVWTGPSPMAVVAVQIVLGALTAALVCRIGQRVLHPTVGLVGGLAFAVDPVSLEYACYTATETLGTFLFVLSLDQLFAALQEGRRSASWWAGVDFALSNLTRTLTLLAAPVLFLALLLAGRSRGVPLRSRIVLALLFALGAGLPLGTWIVRQKLVHDLTTISDNTASGLFAAASPKYGSWTSAVDREAEEAGIPPDIKSRYQWFMKRFWEELAARPAFYLRNAAGSGWAGLVIMASQPAAVSLLMAALLLALWLARVPDLLRSGRAALLWTGFIALLVPAVCTWPRGATAVLAPLGTAVAVSGRRGLALVLAGCFAAVLGATAMFALGSDARLLMMASWMMQLVTLLGIVWLGGLVPRLLAGGDLSRAVSWPSAGPVYTPAWQRWLGRAVLAWFAASLSVVGYRTFVSPLPPEPGFAMLTPAGAGEALTALERLRPGSVSRAEIEQPGLRYRDARTLEEQRDNHGRLVVAHGRLSRYRYRVPAVIETDHYSRMFQVRGYPREYTFCNGATAESVPSPAIVVLAAPLPESSDRDLLVIGRCDFDHDCIYEENYLEVLAWARIDQSGCADLEHLQVTSVAAHAALVDGLRK